MSSSSGRVFILTLFVFSAVWTFSVGAEDRRWPSARIPYQIKANLSPAQLLNISLAMNQIEEQSCIQFQPLARNEEFYMEILYSAERPTFPDACYVDHIGLDISIAEQNLHLGNESCYQVGVIMHELVHTIGFYHEQARCDRDDFVRINWENVQTGTESNFDILEFQPIGPYDYLSLMHYPKNLFATNLTLDTITPLNSHVNETGRLSGLSPCDIYKINWMYSCSNQDVVVLREACEKYVRDSWGDQGHNSGQLQQFDNDSCLHFP